MVVPYKIGQLFYHTGHVLHQIVGYKLDVWDRRITLQGHGVKCDGYGNCTLDFDRSKNIRTS
ncbi:MAG: hypothetical protein CM15mV22_0790 [Eurybiavirus sp.]|nr:MAG: hypothetical protein CM15mV22_0790 [Eurybiavirus sp.]